MKIQKVPFTQKFPYNYIVTFDDGVAVSTTNELAHQRLVMLIEDHDIKRFFDIEASRRMQIECKFNVVKPVIRS